MTIKSLSPSKIAKLQEVFGAALRKAAPPDQEAQELIESHWAELEPELMSGFTSAINKVRALICNCVRLTITTLKEFVKPDWMKRLVKGNDPVEPGDYVLTFEPFLNNGENSVKGDEMVRRAQASGAVSGLQIALYLLDNQHLIPTEFQGKEYLVFAGTEALDSGDYRHVACLSHGGFLWFLGWRWLEYAFCRGGLLVRARKVQ